MYEEWLLLKATSNFKWSTMEWHYQQEIVFFLWSVFFFCNFFACKYLQDHIFLSHKHKKKKNKRIVKPQKKKTNNV